MERIVSCHREETGEGVLVVRMVSYVGGKNKNELREENGKRREAREIRERRPINPNTSYVMSITTFRELY